jgi:lipoyl(octanoyl) transferase
MSEPAWRLLLDEPAAGAWNMAVDEVVLDGVASGAAPATVRFYGWKPACLSLGYFQSFDVVDLDTCRTLGIDIVRRPTGGRAILHDRELTYSVALPAAVLGQERGILPSYHRISRALQAGLRALGIITTMAPESAAASMPEHGPVCFDRPSAHEILLHGRKLIGSAQVRRANALLQHGSILVEPRMATMLRCLRLPVAAGGAHGPGLAIEDGVIGLASVGIIEPLQVAAPIAAAMAAEFHVPLVTGTLTVTERQAAAELMASKYQSASWTARPLSTAGQKTTRTR